MRDAQLVLRDVQDNLQNLTNAEPSQQVAAAEAALASAEASYVTLTAALQDATNLEYSVVSTIVDTEAQVSAASQHVPWC